MSDTESVAAAPHPHLGGKSIQSLERPRYKSWRKKYRKMRHTFDKTFEENRQLYKDEQKMEGIAKRLREELDGLLELCLDINQNPSIPPELRFNISVAKIQPRTPSVVDKGISPRDANDLLAQYTNAVNRGEIPAVDLHVVREQIDERLAEQGARKLEELELSVPHATSTNFSELPEEVQREGALSYLSAEQESDYILRLDAKLGDHFSTTRLAEKDATAPDDKHWAALTSREQDRQSELLNPQSQHNWLKKNQKLHGGAGDLIDDNESLASHDKPDRTETKPPPKKRGNKNLAKQVGDRAVERAREGWSPSGYDDDDLMLEEVTTSSGRKRVKDPDGSYRAKGGRSGTAKGKRKRSGEEGRTTGSPAESGNSKKARVEHVVD